MLCTTVRTGQECAFMTKAGCSYNGGSCEPAVEACEGCAKLIEANGGFYCASTPNPTVKWRLGKCNLATHVKEVIAADQVKLNPINGVRVVVKDPVGNTNRDTIPQLDKVTPLIPVGLHHT